MILASFLGGALLVRILAWPVLRQWWNNIPTDTDLWPHGADEPLGDALERVHPRPGSNLDTCQRILAATELDERRRRHPSWQDPT